MKSLKKMKIGAAAMAATMLVSSVSAFACANDQFVAYDKWDIVDGEVVYNKLYRCPEEGRIVINGQAEKIEWKHAFYEAEYPHREIKQLWLDDTATGYTKFDGTYATVNTKELPDFWESKSPYWVYNRLYSDFTGAFERTNVIISRGETAPVATDWVKKGFDKYVIEEDGTVKDYSHVYGLYDNKINFTWHTLNDAVVDYWNKVAENPTAFLEGKAWDAYKVFDDSINYVSWLELAGPDYVTGGTNKFQPFAKVVAGSPADWYDDVLVTDNAPTLTDYNDALLSHLNVGFETSTVNVKDNHVESDWVTVGYELKAPYRYIEVLSLDGVLMDGREVDIVGYDVAKEEVLDISEIKWDEIQVIEKAVKEEGFTSSQEYFYAITPATTEMVKKVDATWDYSVVEDYMQETVLDRVALPLAGNHRELRFVKLSKQPGKSRLPYIWRYSGGYANPKVEWKVAFAEAEKPYEIFEEKFVDGIATGEYRTTGKFATDVPNVSTVMSQPRVLSVTLTAEVDKVVLSQKLEDSGYEFIIQGDRVIVIVPDDIYEGHVDMISFEDEIDSVIVDATVNVGGDVFTTGTFTVDNTDVDYSSADVG